MEHPSDDSRIFEHTLADGERLLWAGRAGRGPIFYGSDIIRLVVGLIGAFLPVYAVLSMTYGPGGTGRVPEIGYLFLAFGFPLALLAIFSIGLGGFIKRRKMVKHIRYAITNRRVVIADIDFPTKFRSIELASIGGLMLHPGRDGRGTIVLADADPNIVHEIRQSPDSIAFHLPELRFLFEIPDVEYVHSLLKGLIPPSQEVDAPPADDVAEKGLYASKPPRSVQPFLAVMTILGNPLFQIALLALGILSFWARGVCPAANSLPSIYSRCERATAPGIVTDMQVEGWSNSSNRSRKRYEYSFTDSSGRTHTAVFHSDGGRYDYHDRVRVEYVKARPDISWIVGLDTAASWKSVKILLLFIPLWIWLTAGAVRSGMRGLGMLRHGVSVPARLKSKLLRHNQNGDTDIAGRSDYSYDLTYEYRAGNGMTYKYFTKISAGLLSEEKPEAEVDVVPPERIVLLYDPANPKTAMQAKQIAGHPRFDRPGTVYTGRPWRVIGYLILPALVVGGHLLWSYLTP